MLLVLAHVLSSLALLLNAFCLQVKEARDIKIRIIKKNHKPGRNREQGNNLRFISNFLSEIFRSKMLNWLQFSLFIFYASMCKLTLGF